jgi:tetratricopeptide (TPR) repeat protein
MKKHNFTLVVLSIFLLIANFNTTDKTFADEDKNIKEALNYINSGYNKEAIPILQNALRENPNNITAAFLLGMAYMNLNNYDEAIYWFKYVTSIDNRYITAYYMLALIYEAKKEYSTSKYYWERVKVLAFSLNDKNLQETATRHIERLSGEK